MNQQEYIKVLEDAHFLLMKLVSSLDVMYEHTEHQFACPEHEEAHAFLMEIENKV